MRPLLHTPRITRRESLIYGGTGLLAALLGERRAEGIDAERLRIRRLIYLWGDGGGPANPDYLDPQPRTSRIHSIYRPIATSVPGVHIAEAFPATAAWVHQLTVFRGRVSDSTEHASAIAGGLRRDTATRKHLLTRIADEAHDLPFAYAEAPDVIRGSNYRRDAFSVDLGVEAHWCHDRCTFRMPDFGVPHPRLSGRYHLLQQLETLPEHVPDGAAVDRMREHMENANRLLSRGREAAESLPDACIQRYRRDPGTLPALLARELIRQNIASVVLVRMGYSGQYGSFDTHTNHEKAMAHAAPRFDHACAQLIQDRMNGVIPEDTVIVYDTEFGRTPRITGTGRDHFPTHCSWILSDTLCPGAVIGSTEKDGSATPGRENGEVDNATFADIVWESVRKEPDFAARARLPAGILR